MWAERTWFQWSNAKLRLPPPLPPVSPEAAVPPPIFSEARSTPAVEGAFASHAKLLTTEGLGPKHPRGRFVDGRRHRTARRRCESESQVRILQACGVVTSRCVLRALNLVFQ